MDRYSKIKRIGSGTFGQAWLVESTVSNRMYALKELGVTVMSEQDRHLALNEAKILSKLKHKNIVRYKEAFVDQGKLCIAMEFAEKGDLYTRIKERNGLYFPETQILEWFTQLCLALKYIHGQNILHRDLKTQNIFLGKDDIIKLGDFGIARMLNSTLDHAQTTVGTPYYLSPEICQRKPYNHKSDMWSLGCVLYEMATLKHAFNANNFSALVIKILQGQYPPIPGFYGPLLEDLVSVLLQKNPNDRPSAKQLLYVPAMQPYVKRFLQCERERGDSVASDVSEISSRSNADCSRSRISSSSKREKEDAEENMVRSSNISNQDGQIKLNPNIAGENARSSSKERRFSTNKAPIANAQGNYRSSKSGPDVRVADNGQKTKEAFLPSDNTSKARENLPIGSSADVKKQRLFAIAHAQQRRHSQQTSARLQPRTRIPKGRIHSQGAQARDNFENENDVFTVNHPMIIHKRKPDVKNVSKPSKFMKNASSASASGACRVTTVTEEQKQNPATSLCQLKSSEVARTRMRHQSAVTTDASSRCPIEQKHRRLSNRSELNRVNKENGAPSQPHIKVAGRCRSSSGVLQQIQTTNNTESQPTVKRSLEATGNEREIRKRTYTISQERRPSAFQIPELDGQKKYKDGNGSSKGGKESCKDENGSEHCQQTTVHVKAETTDLENKRNVLPPSSKFTFCGKTLHLDNVSSHDSIYSHLEALRMYLEKELGTRLLTAVYRYVTNVSLDEHDRIKQNVTAMLGEDKMTYFPVLLQLVACEAIYFH